jgi:hypothetical protein
MMDMVGADPAFVTSGIMSEGEDEEEFLGKDEALMGRHLHKDHMLLSPKLKDLI